MFRFVLAMARVLVRMVAVALVGRLSVSRPQSRCGSTYLSREATKACSLWFQPQVIALNQFEVAKRRRFLLVLKFQTGLLSTVPVETKTKFHVMIATCDRLAM